MMAIVLNVEWQGNVFEKITLNPPRFWVSAHLLRCSLEQVLLAVPPENTMHKHLATQELGLVSKGQTFGLEAPQA
jgi:hypothetical protein